MGIDIYDAELRELDHQIGRWWQIDPKTEGMDMWSAYASNYDNPIRYSDPLGDEGSECCGGLKDWLAERWEAQKRGVYLVGKSIGEVATQAWENVKDNWSAGRDPIHDLLKNPLSVISGPTAVEAKAVNTLAEMEVKAVASEVQVTAAETKVAAAEANTSKAAAENGMQTTKSDIQIPTLKEQASNLKELNGGKNSITIKTPNKQIRYDLDGKAHGGVETPHKQIYIKNFLNGELKSISRESKQAQALTQQNLRIVRKFIENTQKQKKTQ